MLSVAGVGLSDRGGWPAVPQAKPAGQTFGEILGQALSRLAAQEARADELAARLARGEAVELHEVILAGEKAQLALELAVQVRNKVVEAYQEIMRMPL